MVADMATSILTLTVTAVTSSVSPTASADRAPSQSGVLEGSNPTQYNASNPIILFIIQAGIILIFCRLLHYPLSTLRQPRVIAEVIGGIILGPSVMMRIPGFQNAIFPTASMPILNLVANLGLILFLFLVALEVDLKLFKSNSRVALSVGLAGMILPFGLGCGIAWGLYNQFRTDSDIQPISFGVYMLFIGTALAITAFPVLCRILTELKILGTPVGVTVLAAGIGNDVAGWILLALCVALVNNSSGLTALYALLCCIAWILFLFIVVRPCFPWALKKLKSTNEPTQTAVALTLLLTFTSAWFTGIIGIHPIFGGFLMGLICPRKGGFARKLAEKIEDLVTVLFLPLYFALSGLSTNLGLLNDGITWAYVIGVIAVAFGGKIIGGTLAAKSCKLAWRESLTIGVLMSCKGLVELIVLNIGLQAKILSTRTFTIFVVMALVTTIATTPLVTVLYPPEYQKTLDPLFDEHHSEQQSPEKLQSTPVRRLLVYLRLDSLPSLFTFVALLGGEEPVKPALVVHGHRMLERTERTSSVMKSSGADGDTMRDPIVNAFHTFAQLNHIAVSGGVSVVPESSYADTINSKALAMSSDLVLIPWSETGTMSESDQCHSLLEIHSADRFANGSQMSFIRTVLDTAKRNTVVFINQDFGPVIDQDSRPLHMTISRRLSTHREVTVSPVTDLKRRVLSLFFGGLDDLVALRLVFQLAHSTSISATIVHVKMLDDSNGSISNDSNSEDASTPSSLRDLLPAEVSTRVTIENSTSSDIATWFEKNEGPSSLKIGDLIIVGRRKGSSHIVTQRPPASTGSGSELRRTLGPTAEFIISTNPKASLLVVQAAVPSGSGPSH